MHFLIKISGSQKNIASIVADLEVLETLVANMGDEVYHYYFLNYNWFQS